MPKFHVVKPIVVDNGEKGTKHYPKPGAEVELTDAQAAPLLAAGRVKPATSAPGPEPVKPTDKPAQKPTQKPAEG